MPRAISFDRLESALFELGDEMAKFGRLAIEIGNNLLTH